MLPVYHEPQRKCKMVFRKFLSHLWRQETHLTVSIHANYLYQRIMALNEDVREEDFEPTLKAKKSLEKRPTLKAKRRLIKGDKFHLGDSSQIIEMAKKLKVLPTITVAGYISREKSGDQDEEDKVTIPECFKERMSVMLPLPILPGTRTTFPVVVNGFFALSEDRRAVKFETEDDQSDQVHYTALI